MEPIINRVAESDIEVFDLAALWDGAPIDEIDLVPFLHEGLVLREKAFREHAKTYDWSQHDGHHVALFCSTDALVPTWAYMLVASRLEGHARSVAFGQASDLVRDYFTRALEALDWSPYQGRIVVIKGCGSQIVPGQAYLTATQKLQRVASKLMYGEPCSSVPLWRRKVAQAAPPEARPVAMPAAVKPARPPAPTKSNA